MPKLRYGGIEVWRAKAAHLVWPRKKRQTDTGGVKDKLSSKVCPPSSSLLPPVRSHLLVFPDFLKLVSWDGDQALGMWSCGKHFIFKPYKVVLWFFLSRWRAQRAATRWAPSTGCTRTTGLPPTWARACPRSSPLRTAPPTQKPKQAVGSVVDSWDWDDT